MHRCGGQVIQRSSRGPAVGVFESPCDCRVPELSIGSGALTSTCWAALDAVMFGRRRVLLRGCELVPWGVEVELDGGGYVGDEGVDVG